MNDEKLKEILNVYMTMQRAKDLPRQGYITVGFRADETDTVASHSFCVSILSYMLAKQMQKDGESIDPDKVLKIAVFHDTGEAVTGDVGTYIKKFAGGKIDEVEEKAFKALYRKIDFKDEIVKLRGEFDKQETPEARLVKIVDRIDVFAQALRTPGAHLNKFLAQAESYKKKLNSDIYSKAIEMMKNKEVEEFWAYEE